MRLFLRGNALDLIETIENQSLISLDLIESRVDLFESREDLILDFGSASDVTPKFLKDSHGCSVCSDFDFLGLFG